MKKPYRGRHVAPTNGSSHRRWIIGGVVPVLLVVGAAMALAVGDYDLRVAGRNGFREATLDDGAVVQYIGDLNTTFGSAGSGIFESFVRLQGNKAPTQKGYNTDGTRQFDTKAGAFTHSILLSDIPTIEVGGNPYWEFFSDINESDSTKLISLDDFELYLTSDKNLTGYPFTGTADKIYDYNDLNAGFILINDVNQGSGRGDLRYLVPQDDFGSSLLNPGNCNYGNPACSTYVVLFSEWGGRGAVGGDSFLYDGGFEEWKVKKYPKLQVTKTATPTFTRTFGWTIEKLADPTSHALFDGDSADSDYTVTATKDAGGDSLWAVSGVITIKGDADKAVNATVTDVFAGFAATITSCSVLPNGDGTYTVAAKATVTCNYTLSLEAPTDGMNTATATYTQDGVTLAFTGTQAVVFSDPTTVVNGTVDVTDQFDGGTETAIGTVSVTTTFDDYSRTFDCSGNTFPTDATESDTVAYGNTARVKSGTTVLDSTDASVAVMCYRPTIDKDADTALTRTFGWTISKSVDPAAHGLFVGDTDPSDYTLEVTKDAGTDSDWAVSGDITIFNPHPTDDLVTTDLADTLTGLDATAVTITGCTGDGVTYEDGTLTVAGGETATCAYTVSPTGDAVTLNTASFTLFGIDYSADATVDWTTATVTKVNDTVDVTDQFDGESETVLESVSDSKTLDVYGRDFDCSGNTFEPDAAISDEVSYGNTARVKSGTTVLDSADASVAVTCYMPTISKDAATSFDRDWTWTIDKTADKTDVDLAGGSGTVAYEVTVDATSSDSNWAVSGDITIVNTHPTDSMTVTVSDVLDDATAVTIGTCSGVDVTGGASSLEVGAGATATCAYSASPAGPTPTENTASFTLFGIEYSADATVDWSAATIDETDEAITVTDDWGTPGDTSDDVILGTADATSDPLPKTFEYQRTFTATDFSACGTWDLVNTAEFVTNDTLSSDTASWTVTLTIPCAAGCTPGFWQGGSGIQLWNDAGDPLAIALGTYFGKNPFTAGSEFGYFFDPTGLPTGYDTKTLLDVVGSGAGRQWSQKAARSLVAALLNAADTEIAYPASLEMIMTDWNTAQAASGGDDDLAFKAFQVKYGAYNELGCERTGTSSAAVFLLPLAVLASAGGRLWYKGRHRE